MTTHQPWLPGDLRTLLGGLVLGATGLTIAWVGASGTTGWSSQLVWIALGGAAVIGSGLTNAAWLLRGYRSLRRRQRHLVHELRDEVTRTLAAGPEHSVGTEVEALVSGPRMSRYHRSDCLLVAGKATRPLSRGKPASRLAACGVCRP